TTHPPDRSECVAVIVGEKSHDQEGDHNQTARQEKRAVAPTPCDHRHSRREVGRRRLPDLQDTAPEATWAKKGCGKEDRSGQAAASFLGPQVARSSSVGWATRSGSVQLPPTATQTKHARTVCISKPLPQQPATSPTSARPWITSEYRPDEYPGRTAVPLE